MSESYRCKVCGSQQACPVLQGVRDWEFGAAGVFDYLQCTQCQQIQLIPFPSIADLQRAYPEDYTAYVEDASDRGVLYRLLFKINDYVFRKSLKGRIPENAKVLDVGCGNGSFLERLRSLGGQELHGVDFSPKAIALARARGIEVFEGVFLDMPVEQNSFDAAFMINYIEHVQQPLDELEKAFALLQPGSYLMGELPNFDSLDRKWFGKYWGGNHVPRHTFQFTPQSLEKLLKQAGFVDIKIKHELNPSHIAISLQNWLQRNKPDLKNNASLKQGRMAGFNLLMLALLPLNCLFVLLKRSGIIKFEARKP